MRLIWSRRANTDIELLREYIAQDSPIYARHYIERILKRIDNLPDFPLQGRKVPEAGREDIREIIFQDYRIIYRTSSDHLFIVTIVHGRRNLAGGEGRPWDE
jgi:addiction module RelE/StbE family toxin